MVLQPVVPSFSRHKLKFRLPSILVLLNGTLSTTTFSEKKYTEMKMLLVSCFEFCFLGVKF